MPDGYDSAAQNARNNISHMLANYPWLYGVMAGLALLAGLVVRVLFRLLRRTFRRAAA